LAQETSCRPLGPTFESANDITSVLCAAESVSERATPKTLPWCLQVLMPRWYTQDAAAARRVTAPDLAQQRCRWQRAQRSPPGSGGASGAYLDIGELPTWPVVRSTGEVHA